MASREGRWQYIAKELVHHLPASAFGVVTAVIIMAFLTFLAAVMGAEERMAGPSENLFHVFHPFHILFSSVTTTAIFWKHDNRSWVKAALVGFFGSVLVCALSDYYIPFLGGKLLGWDMHLHVCAIQEPGLVYPFAFLGVLAGFFLLEGGEHATQYSHGMHVFLSSTAALLYLISFGFMDWMHNVPAVFFVTLVAVVIPCCTADIIFPMLCTHRYCKHKE